MPRNKNVSFLYLKICILLVVIQGLALPIQATQAIDHYYARYDIKSSGHRIVDTNLLMIPSKNEFRSEKFSLILTSSLVKIIPGQAEEDMLMRAKKTAVKSILETHGLKSVQTRDQDTVVSYEGAVITPIKVIETVCDPKQNTCRVSVSVMFSPLSFPDQWEKQKLAYKIKQFFNDFFGFLK